MTVHFCSDWSAGTAGQRGARADLARTSFLAFLAKVTCRNRPNERLAVQKRPERAPKAPRRARSSRTCTPERSFAPNLHVTFRKTGPKFVRAKLARFGGRDFQHRGLVRAVFARRRYVGGDADVASSDLPASFLLAAWQTVAGLKPWQRIGVEKTPRMAYKVVGRLDGLCSDGLQDG